MMVYVGDMIFDVIEGDVVMGFLVFSSYVI